MTKKVYVVTDLGSGDGGKGGVVHKIATMMRAHTVIKRGGAQGSHGVHTSRGEKFAFSQWGCGTLEGIPTHLSCQMVVSPEGLLNEAQALQHRCGLDNPFSLLTIDERALCATPFHGIASRIKELALGSSPRGTVGTGVGEAYRQFRQSPESALKVCDLTSRDLKERLAAIRDSIQAELQYIIEYEFLAVDRATLAEEVGLLYDDGFLDYVVQRFEQVAKFAKIVGREYLGDTVLAREGVAVVETSHGVLTDRYTGFHPHTSAIRTLPRFTQSMLDESGYVGQVVNIGVSRAYAVSHGAGPMPTEDTRAAEYLSPGSSKEDNRYQGKVRVGALDLVLMRYAIEACGGPDAFDGLAITWFDQIRANHSWSVCNSYSGLNGKAFFSPSGEVRVRRGEDKEQLEYQAALGQKLLSCVPEVTRRQIDSGLNTDELYDICASLIEGSVNVPVRMVSFGSTEVDKLCK